MATEAIKIRKLPPWVIDAHKAKAEQAGISLEEEMRRLLTDEALRPQKEWAKKAAAWQEALEKKYGKLSDSTELIRADREERG